MLTEAVLIEQNRQLREENEELRETIRQMRERKDIEPLPDWMPRFTPQEETIFRELLPGRVVSRERLFSVLYGDAESPEPKIIDVYLVRVRHKAASVGLTIKNRWGSGWYLDEASLALIASRAQHRTDIAA